MKVVELLELRRKNWLELERLCDQLQHSRRSKLPTTTISRFASLYRAACADLALADAYQLPPNTVQYLHRLVGRAHNQLYRSRRFRFADWGRMLLVEAPQRIFQDRCVQLMFCLFWGIFILSAFLAYAQRLWPGLAEQLITSSFLERLESDFSKPIGGRPAQVNFVMAAFYIQHNTSIGLRCFAFGLLIVPGFFVALFNAAHLGACFGYMARPDVAAGSSFFQFVTAHAPFELTAIVLSAGAGLRLGVSWVSTRGLSRSASLRKTAGEAMPLMGAAMVLFSLAALIEGFLSASAAPFWLKGSVAVLSSGLLMFYFVILGFPRRSRRAVG